MTVRVPKRPSDEILACLKERYSFRADGVLLRDGREVATYAHKGYRRHGIWRNGAVCQLLVHHIVYFLAKGIWPSLEIDHRNRQRGDNRPSNLVLATPRQNCCNRTDQSVFGIGVSRNKKKFRAEAMIRGVRRRWGRFEDPAEAAACVALARFLAETEEVEGRAA
jgi:hypothetical protein